MLVFGLIQDDSTLQLQRDWFHFSSTTKTVVQNFRCSNYKFLCKTQDPILLNAIDSTFPLQQTGSSTFPPLPYTDSVQNAGSNPAPIFAPHLSFIKR